MGSTRGDGGFNLFLTNILFDCEGMTENAAGNMSFFVWMYCESSQFFLHTYIQASVTVDASRNSV